MTIVEHLKSDSDVFKLIATSLGCVFLCVIVLWLLALRYNGWRKTAAQGKRKQLQRPFVTKRISLTPKDDSPTIIFGPFNHWSQVQSSSSLKKSILMIPSSPTNFDNTFQKRSSPKNYQKKPEKHVSPRFLGQIISCINKSNPTSPNTSLNSPKRNSAAQGLRPIDDYKNPFILDQSTTDEQDSTLPSLLLSSDSSTDCIMEKSKPDMVELQPATSTMKVDKAINTDITAQDNNMIYNNKSITSKDKETQAWREHKKSQYMSQNLRKDEFSLRLWSHKCNFPCQSYAKHTTSYGFPWSYDSSSSSTGDPQTDLDAEQHEQDYQQRASKSCSVGKGNIGRYSENRSHTKKCAADVCVQTKFTGEIQNIYSLKRHDISPLCSSDSTLKEIESSAKCCCRSDHVNANLRKPQNNLKKYSVVTNLANEYAEDSELLENGPSISDRTSFIPAKSWYSLGSLCDEDEDCKTCGTNFNDHMQSDGSVTKLNLSALDAVSYNDTGYTSTEEESNSNSEHSKDTSSSCEHHSNAENGSYDGDYESDDEIFHCRLVASDDMVYKPLPSISEPFAIEEYAAREWKSQTPKANVIRELLRKLVASTQGALQDWSFAGRLEVEKHNVMSTLEEILRFFVEKISKCEEFNTKEAKTDYLLSLFNEETGNSDFRLLEAVKVVMLYYAVQMYEDMNKGKGVPIHACLLFARDSSSDPQSLLQNHLNHVGDSGGLEQVEMCLLGYTLGVVIQVFRPSQVNKQDFIAYYPYLEDVPPLTPTVSLVAEDDRHYNILVD
ncbi:uncharacterized protein LOC116306388 isoform X2 [Actinia tenebrosa]|uniref:Uncharacterized protein LOC116306388 isoform X2 n=1 Tax=Actinia tenebrosa TaxID=6105 RepID=A0A6P8J411_ACTTE|nr:uncharacterized protein LOC116306388 isoform X2 [Actinia tenebrosa]